MVIPAMITVVFWIIGIAAYFTGWETGSLGIFPRTAHGITGIFTSPFLHGDFGHLFANTFPFFVLMTAVLYFYRPIALRVLLLLYILPGLWVWVISLRGPHIGASGVVYGLAFFLFFSGVFRKHLVALTVALVVAFFYGGMVWGVLPTDPNISWEGHLLGAIAGVVSAYFFKDKGRLPRKKYSWEEYEEEDPIEAWNYKRHFPPPEGFSYPEDK